MDNRLFYTSRFFDASAPVEPVADLTEQFRDEDNAAFLAKVASELSTLQPANEHDPRHSAGGEMAIGLIGGYGLMGYGLRRSQEILRLDRGPSYWSHAFLFNGGLNADAQQLRGPSSPWLLECTFRPSAQVSDALYRDGVMPRRLAEYSTARFDWNCANSIPNFAVISIGLTDSELKSIRAAALTPEAARQHLGLVSLAGQWFQYLCDKGEIRNPLTLGKPVHSAAYVQMAYSAASIDLAPGASQNTVAPEHFWGLAKHLQHMSLYRAPGTNALLPRPLRIWTCIRDPHCVIRPVDAASKGEESTIEQIVRS